MTEDGLPQRLETEPVATSATSAPSWSRWSVARRIAVSRLPQVSAFIPAIGYALLWSDYFSDLLGSEQRLGKNLLPLEAKLQFLWWGASFMTAGWAIYSWHCPVEIKRAAEPRDYVIEEFSLRNQQRIEHVKARLATLLANFDNDDASKSIFATFAPSEVRKAWGNPELRRDAFGTASHSAETLLSVNYFLIDHEKTRWSLAAVILLYLGAVLFLIPSGEVFCRVLGLLLPFSWAAAPSG
jgi:hypothetical protein